MHRSVFWSAYLNGRSDNTDVIRLKISQHSLNMSENSYLKFELAAFPAIAAALDGTLTILGQPATYAQGLFSTAHEMNPVGYLFLSFSPTAFIAGMLFWIGLLIATVVSIRDSAARQVSLAITALHVIGASTWLICLPYGFAWVLLLVSIFRLAVYPRFYKQHLHPRQSSVG